MISSTSDINRAFHTILLLMWRYIGLLYPELLISVPYNITYLSDIMSPALLDCAGWGRHWPGALQGLLWPHHCQQTGDMCPAEMQQT